MPAQVDGHDPMQPRKVLSLWAEERAIAGPAVHEDKTGFTRTAILKGQLDTVVHNRRHAASPFSLWISLEPTSRQIDPDPDSHLGRFNSLFARFNSLFVGFISLFGRLGGTSFFQA
jgi:hypothetical protein